MHLRIVLSKEICTDSTKCLGLSPEAFRNQEIIVKSNSAVFSLLIPGVPKKVPAFD